MSAKPHPSRIEAFLETTHFQPFTTSRAKCQKPSIGYRAQLRGQPTNKASIMAWLIENASGVGAATRHFVRQGGNVSPNR